MLDPPGNCWQSVCWAECTPHAAGGSMWSSWGLGAWGDVWANCGTRFSGGSWGVWRWDSKWGPGDNFLGKATWAGGAYPGLLKARQARTALPLSSKPPRPTCWPQSCGSPHLDPVRIFQTLTLWIFDLMEASRNGGGGTETYFQYLSAKDKPQNFFCTPRLCKAPQAALQGPFSATSHRWPGLWQESESRNSRWLPCWKFQDFLSKGFIMEIPSSIPSMGFHLPWRQIAFSSPGSLMGARAGCRRLCPGRGYPWEGWTLFPNEVAPEVWLAPSQGLSGQEYIWDPPGLD